jgi:hypothetical protein
MSYATYGLIKTEKESGHRNASGKEELNKGGSKLKNYLCHLHCIMVSYLTKNIKHLFSVDIGVTGHHGTYLNHF